MKTLSQFLISFFAAAFAMASPVPIAPGVYKLSNYEVVFKKHVENVYAMNEQGKKQLKDLQSQKYDCQHQMNQIYQCSAFVEFHGTENEVVSEVNAFLKDVTLTASQAVGQPSLMFEGDAIKEFVVPQEIVFNSVSYSDYRYIVRPTSESLFLGTPAKATFKIDISGRIFYSLPITLQKTKNSAYKYLVLVEFSIPAGYK